ncbi:uncharacterized protein LOC133816678 [Humulus lupulus]|uniref:uncharacterized protein LOC133816678 n=1 Tax=Humulus lupulus TaxID=3486 RepID=UPI002B414429|nr:uncharacterized protein LOC133816678 [Humulus lupulus]
MFFSFSRSSLSVLSTLSIARAIDEALEHTTAEEHSLHWNCRLFLPQFVIEESEENGDRSLPETLFDLMKHHFETEEVTVEAPLRVLNVQVIDLVTGKPCKVGIKYLEDGTKVRVSRGLGASGSVIPLLEILKIRTTPRPIVAGPKDTPMDVVMEKTYDAKTGRGMPEL